MNVTKNHTVQRWTPDQEARRAAVLSGQTVIANMTAGTDTPLIAWAKASGHFVRIDRQSIWGNPYVLDRDGDRDAVCDRFAVYLAANTSLQAQIGDLRGKVLACWCYPKRCHGDHLAARATEVAA